MALTQEQIDNLKKGDPIVIHTTFDHVDDDDDIWFNAPTHNFDISYDVISPNYVSLPSEHGTSVPPKYAPTRLFKKGDIVEMDTHGRDIAASMEKAGVDLGKRYTVTEDENNTGYVSFIGDDGIEHHSMFFWLKLVTPVEELDPYKLIDSPNTYNIVRGKNTVITIHKKSHPHPKESAEAERDRLNTEWRKEQNNE